MDDARTLTMSAKELNRLEILSRVMERRLTQAQAAEQLGLSVRQVERLCRKLRVDGPRGLVSKKRGTPSNRKLPAELRERALALVKNNSTSEPKQRSQSPLPSGETPVSYAQERRGAEPPARRWID